MIWSKSRGVLATTPRSLSGVGRGRMRTGKSYRGLDYLFPAPGSSAEQTKPQSEIMTMMSMFSSMLERQREADRQQRNEEREILETQRKIEREKDAKLGKLEREAE